MKLIEVNVGDKFVFNNKIFEKINNLGLFFGICNSRNVKENTICHINLKSEVSLLN